jgi:hypothetical protein
MKNELFCRWFGMALACVLCSLAVPIVGQDGSSPQAAGDIPTFSQHVAPIVFQNCVSCHRPGEAAPFSLMTYEDARKRARQISEVTAKKFMPPWHAEAGHMAYLNARVLSEEQIEVLQRWYKGGMPEGDRAKLPKLPVFTEGWQLGKPDLVLKMDRPFKVYAEGRDIYRNFVFPLNSTEDKWVRAIEFRPSARSVVHHALFFLDTMGTARELDAADEQPGFTDKGRAGRKMKPVGGWAVGSNVRVLPDGLAYLYPKGADLVVQTHFHPSGKEEEEVSTVGLFFADNAPTRSFVGVQLPPAFGEISGIDIPAGEPNYVVKDQFILPIEAEAFAISPHAHYLAKTMTMRATLPGGKELTLLRIPDWDFAWQEHYVFKERLRLPQGTRLETELVYDNSASNPRNPTSPPVRVKWGLASTDEMGSVTLHLMPSKEAEVETLRDALKDHSTDMVIDRAVAQPTQGKTVKNVIQRFDKNGNSKIDEDERPELRLFIRSNDWVPGNLNNSF